MVAVATTNSLICASAGAALRLEDPRILNGCSLFVSCWDGQPSSLLQPSRMDLSFFCVFSPTLLSEGQVKIECFRRLNW